ncbi:MAG: YdeI/OmpD-associated family protein [candidate division WOR-3 bacterium]|nr:MAG: YdeI/OmpD-associated family protein [candidate division WOR-3 bacterium]
MKITDTLYVTDRDAWRTWLIKNHETKKEVWLIYYKKHTGKPSITYDDAVEEALCFGWIDSVIQKIDEEKYARKYTPRSIQSTWSASNIKRAQKMVKEGRMTKAGLLLFEELEKNPKKASRPRRAEKKLTVPPDLKKALTKNNKALENFNNFAPSYRKIYILWIADAKRRETRERRIKHVVKWSEQNEKPGML